MRLLELGPGHDHGGGILAGRRGGHCGSSAGIQDFRQSLDFASVVGGQELVVGNGFEKGIGLSAATVRGRLLSIAEAFAAFLALSQGEVVELNELGQFLALVERQVVLAGLGLRKIQGSRFIVGFAIALHAAVESGMGSSRP